MKTLRKETPDLEKYEAAIVGLEGKMALMRRPKTMEEALAVQDERTRLGRYGRRIRGLLAKKIANESSNEQSDKAWGLFRRADATARTADPFVESIH